MNWFISFCIIDLLGSQVSDFARAIFFLPVMAPDASSAVLRFVEVLQVWTQFFPTVFPLYYCMTPASTGEDVKWAYKEHIHANLGVDFSTNSCQCKVGPLIWKHTETWAGVPAKAEWSAGIEIMFHWLPTEPVSQ